jgi:hypothetical protein
MLLLEMNKLKPMMLLAEYNAEIITRNILRFVTCFPCMFVLKRLDTQYTIF